MKVIIAEKPSVARDIADVLNIKTKKRVISRDVAVRLPGPSDIL